MIKLERLAVMHEVTSAARLSDEIHRLKDLGTATAARVDRHMGENPDTRLAGWTGSLTDKSLTEYGHLAKWALKSPYGRIDQAARVMTAKTDDGNLIYITREDVCDLVSEVIRLRLEASSLKLDGES